jgi:hypothetical protein
MAALGSAVGSLMALGVFGFYEMRD